MRNADNFEQGTCLERPNSLGSVIINLNNATNFSTFAFILNSFPVKRTGCFFNFQSKERPGNQNGGQFYFAKIAGCNSGKEIIDPFTERSH